ncbi:hypothetical protein Lal_00022845 [Lupinus albus]|nr:hypothetical protein Lal_00022845 [Lupinus albus]
MAYAGCYHLLYRYLESESWNPKAFSMDPRFQSTSTKNVTHAMLGHTLCWVKIHNLPQEYWSPRIICSIAGGIGTPIALEDATNSRYFGHRALLSLCQLSAKIYMPSVMDAKPLGTWKSIT